MLFKKRWSDGLHSDFEPVDEFESKFGLFGGDGGDDGGGGGDVGSQVDSFSDMPGSVDVASQVDTFSDIPAFSAAPAAAVAAPAVDTFSSVPAFSAAPAVAAPAVDTFAEIGGFSPVSSKGLGSLGNFDPFTANAMYGGKAPAQSQTVASISGAPDFSYLSETAIGKNFGPISPSGAYQAAKAPVSSGVQIGLPEVSIGDKEVTLGSNSGFPGVGVVVSDPLGLGGRAGITGNLSNLGVSYTLPLKDGGVVSLLRR